jgi:hypothetical protein
MVVFLLSVWDGILPRFFGVARINLFSFRRYCLTFLPEALVDILLLKTPSGR